MANDIHATDWGYVFQRFCDRFGRDRPDMSHDDRTTLAQIATDHYKRAYAPLLLDLHDLVAIGELLGFLPAGGPREAHDVIRTLGAVKTQTVLDAYHVLTRPDAAKLNGHLTRLRVLTSSEAGPTSTPDTRLTALFVGLGIFSDLLDLNFVPAVAAHPVALADSEPFTLMAATAEMPPLTVPLVGADDLADLDKTRVLEAVRDEMFDSASFMGLNAPLLASLGELTRTTENGFTDQAAFYRIMTNELSSLRVQLDDMDRRFGKVTSIGEMWNGYARYRSLSDDRRAKADKRANAKISRQMATLRAAVSRVDAKVSSQQTRELQPQLRRELAEIKSGLTQLNDSVNTIAQDKPQVVEPLRLVGEGDGASSRPAKPEAAKDLAPVIPLPRASTGLTARQPSRPRPRSWRLSRNPVVLIGASVIVLVIILGLVLVPISGGHPQVKDRLLLAEAKQEQLVSSLADRAPVIGEKFQAVADKSLARAANNAVDRWLQLDAGNLSRGLASTNDELKTGSSFSWVEAIVAPDQRFQSHGPDAVEWWKNASVAMKDDASGMPGLTSEMVGALTDASSAIDHWITGYRIGDAQKAYAKWEADKPVPIVPVSEPQATASPTPKATSTVKTQAAPLKKRVVMKTASQRKREAIARSFQADLVSLKRTIPGTKISCIVPLDAPQLKARHIPAWVARPSICRPQSFTGPIAVDAFNRDHHMRASQIRQMNTDFLGYWKRRRSCLYRSSLKLFHDQYAVAYASLNHFVCR